MFTLDFIINPIVVVLSVIAGGILGYLINRGQLAKSRAKINELEKEMMDSHAEILEIQKAYVSLENKFEEHSIPVISMTKINGKEKVSVKENPKEKATK